MRSQLNNDLTSDDQCRTPRQPLQLRSPSDSNSNSGTQAAAIRIVPKTPPRLLGNGFEEDDYYHHHSRPPLPTQPSHFLNYRKEGGSTLNNQTNEFHKPSNGGSKHRGLVAEQNPITSPIKGARTTFHAQHQNHALLSPSASTSPKPSVRKRQLFIHEDSKTFSLRFPDEVESNSEVGDENAPYGSPNSTRPSSSNSIKTPLIGGIELAQGRQVSSTQNLSSSSCKIANDLQCTPTSDNPKKKTIKSSIKSLPCNNSFTGGLREVAETPDKQEKPTPSDGPSLNQPLDGDESSTVPHDLSSKLSFSSAFSTSSETTNYKVYGDASVSDSPLSLQLASPNDSVGSPSPYPSPESIFQRSSYSETECHQALGSSSLTNPSLDNQNSPNSLIVSPLKLRSQRRNSNPGHSPTRSRDHFKSSSLPSASLTYFQKESLRGVFNNRSFIQVPLNNFNFSHKNIGPSSWAGSSQFYPPWSHMNEYPHQWSSQLSTVLSVSENGSDRDSRSWSEHSRNSISSQRRIMSGDSAFNCQDLTSPNSRVLSWNDSLIDVPPAALSHSHSHRPKCSSCSSVKMIADLDEHGDGITDMQNMRVRPLRRRTSGYYSSASSDNGRTNTMRSSLSTHSTNLNLTLIPAWARLYYGSGERRLFSSRSTIGGGPDSRSNSLKNISQGVENLASNLTNQRKRLRDSENSQDRFSVTSDSRSSLNLGPQKRRPANNDTFATWNVANLWSPHLRPDRTKKRTCIWGPPPADFTMEKGIFGRRNIQVLMFIIGFIFPFSWMIASVLPLPKKPITEMSEDDRNSPSFDVYKAEHQFDIIEEARYESAAWWRKVNRWMSFVGLMIIASVVVLVVIGLEQGWGLEQVES